MTDEPIYLSAEEEEGHKFAQSNLPLNEDGSFVAEKIISREEKQIIR